MTVVCCMTSQHTQTQVSHPLHLPVGLCKSKVTKREKGVFDDSHISKFSSKSRIQCLFLFITCFFFFANIFFLLKLKGTCAGHRGLCPPGQLPLHFSSGFKCKKRESVIEREKGDEGERHIWKWSEEEWASERKNLGKQRTAIYEKTKGPRPGSLKQELAVKGVCLCKQQKGGPWYVGIGEELSSWAIGGRLGPKLRYFGILLFPSLFVCLLQPTHTHNTAPNERKCPSKGFFCLFVCTESQNLAYNIEYYLIFYTVYTFFTFYSHGAIFHFILHCALSSNSKKHSTLLEWVDFERCIG